MVVMKWLNRLVTRRRAKSEPQPSPVLRRERRLKLMRLEQRRVLNADFTFDPNIGLSLANVDGDLTVREVSGRVEFDLAGSIWQDTGDSGLQVDNSDAGHSVLSIDKTELLALSGGLAIDGVGHSVQLTFDTQANGIHWQTMAGALTVQDFGSVQQSGSNGLLADEVSIVATDRIELHHFTADHLTLSATEIDFTGGTNSVSGTTLAILPGSSSTIELGGQFDQTGELNFTDRDLAALSSGFQSIRFGDLENATLINVHESGADFGSDSSVELIGSTTLHGNLVSHGGAIHLEGQLVIDGSQAIDTTGGGTTSAGSITINGSIRGSDSDSDSLDRLTLDAALGAVDGVDDASIYLWGSDDWGNDSSPQWNFDFNLSGADVHFGGVTDLSGGELTVSAADQIFVSGSIVSHGGDVNLDAGSHGTLLVSGTIDVSDSQVGHDGGRVQLLGDRVGLFGDANVNASGSASGGLVLIGGDIHGTNTLNRNASRVFVGDSVSIHADSTSVGDGGTIVVWSDEATQVYGRLTARGGVVSGDGGFIETSSHAQLFVSRGGDASATNGRAGTWLLDPLNVTIRDTLSGLGVDDDAQLPNFTPTASGSEVTDDAIETQLNAGTSVVISTANAAGGEAGNVTQLADAAINVSFNVPDSSAQFTINAANHIVLEGGITTANGSLDVILHANTTPDDLDVGSGNVTVLAEINTNGGSFTSTGVDFENVNGAITAVGGVTLIQTGSVNLGRIDTGSDDLSVIAVGSLTDAFASQLTAGGNASFSAANILLDGVHQFGSLTFNSAGAVSIYESDSTLLRGVSSASSLALRSDGLITNDGSTNLMVTDNASFNGLAITLGEQSGDLLNFGSLTFNSTGVVRISEDSNMLFSGSSSASRLFAASSGEISNDVVAVVSVENDAKFQGSSIVLGDQAGDVLNFGSLTFVSPGTVSVLENSDIVLTGVSSATTLDLNSTNTISSDSSSRVTVDGHVLLSGTSITLADENRFGSLTFLSDGEVVIQEANSTLLVGTSSSLSLDLRSSDAITNADAARLLIDSNARFEGRSVVLGEQFGDLMTFGSLTFVSINETRITQDSMTLLSGTSSAQSLRLNSVDFITNDGTAVVTVSGNAAFDAVSLNLGDQSGDAMSFGSLTFVADGSVLIAADSAAVLSGTSSASALTLSSDDVIGNDGTADVTIATNASFTAEAITLTNTFRFGSLTFVSNGAVEILEADSTMLHDSSAALSLRLASIEAIANDGSVDLTVQNHASFVAESIALTDTYRLGSLSFSSPGAVEIVEANAMNLRGASTALTLDLTSNDAIAQEIGSTLIVTESANLVAFSGSLLFDQANDFGGIVTLLGGDAATLNDLNSLTLGDSRVAGLLRVTAADSIALSGLIDAGSASLAAASGSISGSGVLAATTMELDAVTGIFGSTPDDALLISGNLIAADNADAFDVRLLNDTVLDATVTSLTSRGGDLDFSQIGFGSVTFTGLVTSGGTSSSAPAAGGSITLSSAGDLTVTALPQALSSESGSGGSLSIRGATIQRAIVVGAGDIVINGSGENLIITKDIVANASVNLSAQEDVVISSTITAVGAESNLTITADLDLDGVGGFWLNEGPTDSDARLSAGQDITIQGTNLLATAAGNDGIRIDADGDSQQTQSGRDLSLSTVGAPFSNAGDIVIEGRQSALTGSLTFLSNNNTLLGANQVAGVDQLFDTNVRLTHDVLLTAGGHVTFARLLDDDGSSSSGSALTINAVGDVLFADAVGSIAGDRLDTLTIVVADSVEFRSTVTIDGDLDITTSQAGGVSGGTVSFADDVVTTTGLASGSVEITNSGLLSINTDANFFVAGSFTQDGAGATDLGANITTNNGGISFDRAVLLTESVFLDSSARDGNITFLSTIDSEGNGGNGEFNSLRLTSDDGVISFNGDIGAASVGESSLGNLIVETAGQVLFGGADAGGEGNPGPVSVILLDGEMNIGVGENAITDGIVFNAGAGVLVITTTDDQIRLNGAVTLSSEIEINTNSSGAGGTVLFTASSTIDSQFGESNGLLIDVGTQQVLFNNDIGLVNSIGTLIITQADNGVIFGQSDANQGPGSTGPVTTISAEGAIDIGVGSNVIVGGITFNAGNDTLRITTTDEAVRLNGMITLSSNLSINTNTSGTGGTVTFTSSATIDSQSGEHRNLTIDVGTQQVLFNNDIGATQELGALTVIQANGGVVFGESDLNLGPGLTGPVSIIATDGAIDIGVSEHVVPGGIVLNAGSGTFRITTTDDSVRFNGPVTLSTHLDIDTNSNGIGGTVTFTNSATVDSQTAEHNDLRIDAGTQQVAFNNDIGATQSLGDLTITQADGGVTFGQPVIFGQSDVDQSPGTTGPVEIIATDGAIDIGVGSHVISGGIVLNAGNNPQFITTTDDAIRFNGAVTLASDLNVDTNASGLGGTVTFTSAASIDSQTDEHNDLVIDAGSQDVLFNNDLGAFESLGSLIVTQADAGVIFGQADTNQGPGTVGPVTVIATNEEINIGVGENVIAGAGIIFNAGTSTLRMTTTDDEVRLNGVVTLDSSLDIDSNATGDGGTVTFTSAATIDGAFGESNSLTIDAGTQQALFNNDIGRNDAIGALTITQADGGVIFGQSDIDLGPGTIGPVTTIVTSNAINIGVDGNVITGGILLNADGVPLRIITSDDSVRFNGALTLASGADINTNTTPLTGGGTVTFTSATTIDSEANEQNDLTIDAGSQQVLFNNNLGANQSLGALIVTQADAGVIFGQTDTDLGAGTTGPVAIVSTDGEINIGVAEHVITGGIVLNAGSGFGGSLTLQITSTDDPVRFNGAVTLNSNVEIDTNATDGTGGGTVTFSSAATIDSQDGEFNDLLIDAGAERVLFNADLGNGIIGNQKLGLFTIVQADGGVTFGQSDNDEGPGTTGPVRFIATDEAINIGVGENVIEFGIVLNAGTSLMEITTTDDTIRLNGPVSLGSDVDINTHFTPGLGATVTFTSGATIDSAADEHNDLTIDVGSQQVLFNNDIGGAFSLGAFTILQADTGVIFGQADTDQGPGTIGTVTTISTDDAIDIGYDTHVIDGNIGIVFNAGADTLDIKTTNDTVRINGAVTLQSALDIDTNGFPITIGNVVGGPVGGTVTFTANATIDSEQDEFNSLTIDAGNESVRFNDNIGSGEAIGALTITQADAGVLFGQTDTDLGPGTTGPVEEIRTNGDIDIGVLGHIIDGSGIVLNGGASGLLTITTTDHSARFNGAVTLATNVEIDTNDIGVGGTVTFTSSGTIDSESGERSDLTIDAGLEQVLFNNNIGQFEPLDVFLITQADGGVAFGESDTNLGDGTTGPVQLVSADGLIDIGVNENVIFGGIRLNGGTQPNVTLPIVTIESNLDRIRLNGLVTQFGPVRPNILDLRIQAREGVTLTNEASIVTNDHSIQILGDTDDSRANDMDLDAIVMNADTVIDSGNGFIHLDAASIFLGSLVNTSSNGTTSANPAILVTATTAAITDVNEDFTNLTANAVGAGVVLNAVTGIGSGDALETEIDTLQARNMDAATGPAIGNIQIIESPSGGDLNLINLRNQATAAFDTDMDNGVIDVLVARDPDIDLNDPTISAPDGSITVLDDGLGGHDEMGVAVGLLAQMKNLPSLPVVDGDILGIQSENVIRLTAYNVTINDDLLAIRDDVSIANGDAIRGTISINARGNFSLAANRVISTDENFANSIPLGDATLAEPIGGDPPSTFPEKPRVTDDRITIIADVDHVDHADAGAVFLGRAATISTDSGIEQQISRRPFPTEAGTAFYDHTTIIASDLNSNGLDDNGTKYLGLLTVVIGKPGEKNLIFDVDWGDTPRTSFNQLQAAKRDNFENDSSVILNNSNVNAPTRLGSLLLFDQVIDKDKTRFFIPEGGLTYVIPHEYASLALNRPQDLEFRQPGRLAPSDPFQVRFSLTQHVSMSIQGRAIREPTNGPPEASPTALVAESRQIRPLAYLTTTDVIEDELADDFGLDYTDEANYRLNTGVAEFNIPTTKVAVFLAPTPVIPPPELPKPIIVETTAVPPPQITTETTVATSSSTSLATEEWFELRRLNEDGTTTVERLNDFAGEGLLEKDRFEKFISDRGDGEYEIWFITRESGGGAMIERPVIRFRLEGGRLAPPPDDAPKLIKPFRLIPIPAPIAPDQPDANGADAAGLMPDDDSDSTASLQPDGSAGFAFSGQPTTAAFRSDILSTEMDSATREGHVSSADSETWETSTPSTSVAAGVAMFAVSRRWDRFNTPKQSLFSKAARWARQQRTKTE